MRTRSNYNFTPAQGNVMYVQQGPQREALTVNMDRLLLLLFFAVIPLMWLISLAWQGFLWLVFFTILGTMSLLWLKKGFTARGRLVMTACYTLFAVISLTGLLGGGQNGALPSAVNRGTSTMEPMMINYNTAPPVQSGQPLPDAGTDPSMAGIDPSMNGTDAMGNVQSGGSAAEEVLTRFMESWKTGLVDNMVPLTPQSWRAKVSAQKNGAEQNLYWQFNGKKLENYELEGTATGTDNDTSRTINVLAEIVMKEEHRIMRYNALLLQEGGQWFVDPSSLVSGTRVDTAVAAGADGMTAAEPTAIPTPEPTKAPSSKTKLYYNKNGGRYYHSVDDCPSVADEYLPLKGTFTYGNIGKKPQNTLQPCEQCDAPPKPSN